MRQVVAGQAAIERGKGSLDQLTLGINNLLGGAVGATSNVVALAQALQLAVAQRAADQALAAEQYAIELQDVIAGLAITTAALATGIGGDHAADSGAVG